MKSATNSQIKSVTTSGQLIPCVECFKSLGVPSRHKIYAYLKNEGEATVSELVNLVSLTQPTVSYHLKDMQKHGLLNSRKAGKAVFYSINSTCPHLGTACVLSEIKFLHV